MIEKPVFTNDDRGIGVETLPPIPDVPKEVQKLKQEIVQPLVAASPVPRAFQLMNSNGTLDLYPHKGPNFGRKISGELACYVTSANLMHACYGEYPADNNMVLNNSRPDPKLRANVFLNKFVQDKMLPVGTVVWLKGNLSVNDPTSQKPEAHNHWIIVAGFKPGPNGTRIPLFMDQGSMGSKSPRPIEQILGNERFVHQVFAPRKLYKPG